MNYWEVANENFTDIPSLDDINSTNRMDGNEIRKQIKRNVKGPWLPEDVNRIGSATCLWPIIELWGEAGRGNDGAIPQETPDQESHGPRIKEA